MNWRREKNGLEGVPRFIQMWQMNCCKYMRRNNSLRSNNQENYSKSNDQEYFLCRKRMFVGRDRFFCLSKSWVEWRISDSYRHNFKEFAPLFIPDRGSFTLHKKKGSFSISFCVSCSMIDHANRHMSSFFRFQAIREIDIYHVTYDFFDLTSSYRASLWTCNAIAISSYAASKSVLTFRLWLVPSIQIPVKRHRVHLVQSYVVNRCLKTKIS